MATAGVRVSGLSDLNRALRRTDRDVRNGIRKELRVVAEPVRIDAEGLAVQRISSIGRVWPRMRVGITTDSVYVAPRNRGTRLAERKRPNLAPLLMDRAMQPALERHAPEIERELGDVLDRVAENFSR